MNGGETLNDIGGNQKYKSLGVLLESREIEKCFPKDCIVYFQNLFCKDFGWNLRNKVAHGMLGYESFNSDVADRVIHAFLLLCLVNFKPKEDTACNTDD